MRLEWVSAQGAQPPLMTQRTVGNPDTTLAKAIAESRGGLRTHLYVCPQRLPERQRTPGRQVADRGEFRRVTCRSKRHRTLQGHSPDGTLARQTARALPRAMPA